MSNSAKRAQKAAKLAATKAKQDHKNAVYAAANTEGIPHKYLHIVSTKSVGEIINAAKRKQTKSAKRAANALKPATRKTSSIVKSLTRQARAQLPNGTSNSAIGRVTSKMTVNQIVAAARKRLSLRGHKVAKEATRASLKRQLREQGVASANIKFTKNATFNTLLAAARKRAAAKEQKTTKQTAIQALHDAARQAGISPKYVKLRKGETLSAILRAANKRQGFHTKKNRRAEVKAAIMEVSEPAGISEADIRSAFCVRPK